MTTPPTAAQTGAAAQEQDPAAVAVLDGEPQEGQEGQEGQEEQEEFGLPEAPETPNAPDTTSTDAPVTVPGAVPAVPALTIGTGTTIAAVSAAGIAAGPLGAGLVAAGFAGAAGITAVMRAQRAARTATAAEGRNGSRRTLRDRAGTRGSQRAAGNRTGGTGAGGHLRGRTGGTGAGLRAGGPAPRTGPGVRMQKRPGGAPRNTNTGSAGGPAPRVPRQRGAGAGGAVSTLRAAQTRAGQLRAARKDAAATRADTPRRQQRQQRAADRRRWRDDRRAARGDRRADRDSSRWQKNGGKGRTGGGWFGGLRNRRHRDAAADPATRRERRRRDRDARRDRTVAAERRAVGPRRRAWRRRTTLARSLARLHARRLAALLAATPFGLLSLLLWLPMRLMHLRPPRWGRAVYGALTRTARARHDARAEAARQRAKADAVTGDGPPPDIEAEAGETLPDTAPAPYTPAAQEIPMSFDFRALAEEMLKGAQEAEPAGMMAVLRSLETFPDVLATIAEAFAVVGTRMTADMPGDHQTADAIGDLHQYLTRGADAADAVGKVFRMVHEQEIQRHEDARPGEAMWDTVNNQDD